jgi:hypothetical protein
MNFPATLYRYIFLLVVLSHGTTAQTSRRSAPKKPTRTGSAPTIGPARPVLVADAEYFTNAVDDLNTLRSGTDNTDAFWAMLTALPNGGLFSGRTVPLPAGACRLVNPGLSLARHNVTLQGQGAGATVLHGQTQPNTLSRPLLTIGRVPDAPASQPLRGGGLKDLTLKTDNTAMLPTGAVLDFVEYQDWENVSLEGFGESGMQGGFWESYFRALTFRNCGFGQTPGPNPDEPAHGVLDFDSQSDAPGRDACNNTTFDKLTFSSCAGTIIRMVALRNSTVNINLNGINAENYYHDAGPADEQPLIYMDRVMNINLTGGFITVNPGGVRRSATVLRIGNGVYNGMVNVQSMTIFMNDRQPNVAPAQRLRSFADLGRTAQLSLRNVTLADELGQVGTAPAGGIAPGSYLIEGKAGARLWLDNVEIRLPATGGRTAEQLIDPAIDVTGTLTVRLFSALGIPSGQVVTYRFSGGVRSKL